MPPWPGVSRGPAASSRRRFDVFLSHNSHDKAVVERVAEKLARAGLDPWFDKWCLTPGGRWQEELAEGLAASRACAVFIGPHDVGSWEREELAVALDMAAKDSSVRLFLVLLPGLPEPFEPSGLSPFLSTRTWVDLRRGLGDTRGLQSIINAVRGIPLGPDVPIEPHGESPPYRGLQPFDERHAGFFFGRDADVQRLVEKLKANSFLAVLGPSGSGKSSLARAGLVPALRSGGVPGSEGWRIVCFRPGTHPLDVLAGHLVSLYPDLAAASVRDQLLADPRTLRLLTARTPADSSRVLFLIDQFEEVFTLCRSEDERSAFLLNALHAATADGPSAVVLTLRADFYPRCAAYPELAQQIAAHQLLVGAMGSDGLRQAIEEPARHVGLELEPGLVDTILADIENQPGALPLLEHALLELWERRRGAMLTLEAYQESGGVAGALAKRADGILAGFRPEEREVVRRVLLRLTQPGEGAEDTRRRAPMSELLTVPGESSAVESVVRALADARLVTTGQDDTSSERLIEVSHEALIRSWPQLRRWVEEDRQGLRIHRRLTEAAQDWRSLGRDPGALYRGARLAAAREWAEEHEADLNDLEREFIAASKAGEAHELHAARRRARRLRVLTLTLAVFGAGAALLAVLAIRSSRDARTQEHIALSRALAVQAVERLPTRPDQAMLLSLEAYESDPTPEARDAVVRAIQRTDGITALWGADQALVLDSALSPDGRIVATSGLGNRIRLSDVRTGRRLGKELTGHTDDILQLAFSPDGKTLASASEDHTVRLWDVESGRLRKRLPGGSEAALAVSPDGRRLAISSEGIAIVDIATGAIRRVRNVDEPDALAFSPDGRVLAAATQDPFEESAPTITLWTLGQGGAATPVAACSSRAKPMTREAPVDISFADTRTLAWASADGSVTLFDIRRCEQVAQQRVARPGGVAHMAFTLDGRRLAVGGAAGQIRLLEVPALRPVGPALRGYGPVSGLAFAGRRRLVSASALGVVTSWDLTGAEDLDQHSPMDLPELSEVLGLSPDGRTLAVADFDDFGINTEIKLWDVAAGRPLGKSINLRDVYAVAFSPDGRRIAVGGSKPALALWDVRTQELLAKQADAGDVSSLAFRADGDALASVGDDGKIKLWETRRLRLMREIRARAGGVDFSPDGTLITTSGDPHARRVKAEIRVWNSETGAASGPSMAIPDDTIDSVAVSHDGRMLATGGFRTIRLWDLRTHRQLGEPLTPARAEGITPLAFSADDRTLASGQSGTVMLWDVAGRRQVGESTRGSQEVVFTSNGKSLFSLDSAGLVRWPALLWSDDLDAFRARICGVVRGKLTRAEWEEFLPDEPYRPTCGN
jgi:WD40 repeat protein